VKKILVMTALLAGVLAPAAVAHVEVLPSTVTQNAFTEFTARVPTEREVPTTAVKITFPPQVTVSSFAPPPAGWSLQETLSDDGRTIGVVYRGGTIGIDRYLDFTFLGVGFDTGTAIWKTKQTYADGVVKSWTGPPDPPGAESVETGANQPGPASAVEVVAVGAAPAATVAAAANKSDSSGAGIWLGLIAIVVAAAAFLAAGFLWTTRPMKLPDDEPPASS
jgi:periplasmic copper chaperone A